MKIKIRRTPTPENSGFWSLHTHSRFSVNDALSDVTEIVNTVADMGQRAIGLTDHGNIAGSVQLYKAAHKRGIAPFPGSELYVVADRRNMKQRKFFHMLVNAYTSEGYKNLVKLSTNTFENFYYKQIVGLPDLAEMHEAGLLRGLSATSGCFYGMVSQHLVNGDVFAAKNLLSTMAKWFDPYFVEIQNHYIERDENSGLGDVERSAMLVSIADELGIPVVITQDSHYCHLDQKPAHETLKRLVAFGEDVDDAVFPGDGFHLASDDWMRSHHEDHYEKGMEGLNHLLGLHDLSIPQLDNYSYNIPFTVADPNGALRERCVKALEDMNLSNPKYLERLNTELEIIIDTGMAGYLILVSEVTDWCRENKVFYQARGSASGSIVCWLAGITQADPIKWNLIFERFISRDRTKPPDIDLDVEHERRKELVEWLHTRFVVHHIGTWMEYFLEDEENEESRGSLKVKYYASLRKQGKPLVPWEDIPAEEKEALMVLSKVKTGDNQRPGAFYAYGTHPAGMVLTTTEDEFNSLVPTMKISSSDTFVTQYDMDDIESLGLVKLDVLGLKTLTVLHKTMEFLGRDVFEGLQWIPMSDSKTFRMIAKGDTDGVFQLEGFTTKRGCKSLKPTSVKDIVAAMALFRPATMTSGATSTYIARKHKEENTPERHEIIDRHVKQTYGIMLFQEQVIAVLRDLGMNPDDLTAFLKAVKASNESIGSAGDVISGYRNQVFSLAESKGMGENDLDWLWEAIEGFAKYGFNQAHSTAYGLTAYRCAYLASNHPVEFHAALLSVAAGNKDKEPMYLKTARNRKVRVVSPDINKSGVSYLPEGDYVRKGLLSVKGIGEKTATEIIDKRPEGGYKSLEELCSLVSGRSVTGARPFMTSGDSGVGSIGKLMESGVFGDMPLRSENVD